TRFSRDWSSDVCSSDLVPSEVDGKLIEKLFEADDVVQVGQTIAIIETENNSELEDQEFDAEPAGAMVSEVEDTVSAARQITESRSEERRVGKECRSQRW